MGKKCSGDHVFEVLDLGAGITRMECMNCDWVVIDLDAATESGTVTTPGLFGPARPTIFSALRPDRLDPGDEKAEKEERTGPRFAFGGGSAPRR